MKLLKLKFWKRQIKQSHAEIKSGTPQHAETANNITIDESSKNKVVLNITGENNKIKIGKIIGNGKLTITLRGDNCDININQIYISGSLNILLGQIHPNFGKIKNVTLKIGAHCSFESVKIITFNSNTNILIGENCMFSYDITVYHTDGHPIFEKGTEKIINKVHDLVIGNHVWVGAHSTILKNTHISTGCILGWGGGSIRQVFNTRLCVGR